MILTGCLSMPSFHRQSIRRPRNPSNQWITHFSQKVEWAFSAATSSINETTCFLLTMFAFFLKFTCLEIFIFGIIKILNGDTLANLCRVISRYKIACGGILFVGHCTCTCIRKSRILDITNATTQLYSNRPELAFYKFTRQRDGQGTTSATTPASAPPSNGKRDAIKGRLTRNFTSERYSILVAVTPHRRAPAATGHSAYTSIPQCTHAHVQYTDEQETKKNKKSPENKKPIKISDWFHSWFHLKTIWARWLCVLG